ncbi:MAG: Ig-like domain-containing protein [bacterium]
MKYPSKSNRDVRTFVVSLLAYAMLTIQLAPIAVAANSTGLRRAPAKMSDAGKSSGESREINQFAPVPAPVPQPSVSVTGPGTSVTATKTDNRTPAQSAAPGDTINYTVVIQNTGASPATAVTFTDTIDPNTTLVAGSIQSTPVANPDSYNVIGNVRIQPNAAQGLLANDFNPDNGNGTGITASGPTTTTQNGNLTVNADGSFSYNPAPGFAGTDTFTYTLTVTATGKTDTATVTLLVGNGTAAPGTNVIWFVNSAAASNGDGRLTSPFNCLRGPQCFDSTTTGGAADDPGDNIFLYNGSYTGGLTFLANQRMIGQGASDSLANITGVTVPTASDTLPLTSGLPAGVTITTAAAATNGLNLSTGAGTTVRGVTVGNTTGAKIFGNNFGTLLVGNNTLPDVVLNGTGQALNLTAGTFGALSGFFSVTSTSSGTQGIILTGVTGTCTFGSTTVSGSTTQGILIGTTTADINFGNTTVSGGTDGVSLQNNSAGTRTFGTLGVSGGSGIAFLHANGGGNVTVNGGASFSGAGNNIDIQNMTSGTTINFASSVSVNKSGAGGAGVNLVNNTGSTITFNSLGLLTSAAIGLNATGGGTINVTTGGGAINATGGSAIFANGVTLNANFSAVIFNGGAANGISLTNVAGTSNLGAGALAGATGVSFLVSGGTATVTYNGTITQTTAARVIDIQSKTGGTIVLGGAITSNNGTGQGIFLNGNNGATINFTGGVTISTGVNNAFTATGPGPAATSGGTINVTQNNTTIVNTLTTTTGAALNVTNTTIGASGVTFRSVAATGGTNNGITVNNTGALGGLTVTGNGGTCTTATPTCTGGTIQNKLGSDGSFTQGNGIYLNSTINVSLTRISIQGHQNHGIRGSNVNGFTLDNSLVGTSGVNGTSNTTDVDPTGFGGENSIRFYNLLGSATISNSTLDQGFSKTIGVANDTGTLNRLTITNCTVRESLTAATASDSLFMASTGNAVVNFTINGASQFSATHQFHVDTSAVGTSTMDIQITGGNAFSNSIAPVGAGGGLNLQGGGTDSLVTFLIDGNSFRQGSVALPPTLTVGRLLTAGMVSGAGKFDGKFTNNTVGVSGVAFSGGGNGADGIGIFASGNKAATTRGTGTTDSRFLIQNNIFKRYGQTGVQISAVQGNSTLDATVIGNTMNEPGSAAGGAFAAIWVNAGALPADTNRVDVVIGSASVAANKNTMQDSDPNNATDVFLDRSSCSGCASILNLYRNGSGAAAGQSEAIDRQILVDDNNPTLDLLAGFTNGGGATIGTPAGAPPVPTAPQPIDDAITDSSNTITETAKPTTLEPTAAGNDVTTRPFVSSPRTEAVALVVAPSVQSVVKPAVSQTTTTKPTNKGGKDIAPLVANFPITLGTLQPGKTVTITFSVTVNNPLPPGTTTVSNQGTVSGSNFSSVLTDDPDVAGTNNPTVTNITAPPDIAVRDARAPEPISGTSNMLFTVALSIPAPGPVSVNYATANGGGNPATGGTCAGGADYETTSGTVNFTAGQRIRTVPVVICADATVEPDETFLLNLTAPVGGNIVDGQAVGTITPNVPGTTLISEVRTSGPSGTADDFVEIYNNTNAQLTVAASDASAGYGLFKLGADCNATPVLVGTIPNGTVIPARGHYLFVGSTYSLGAYAAGNQALTADIENDSNIGLFTTADVGSLSTVNRLDAVGFGTNTGGAVCDLLREGTSLQLAGGSTSQYSFVRSLTTGISQDGNDNATDFVVASTTPGTPVGSNLSPTLGAPGPENATSPIQRNATIKATLIDPGAVSTAAPNRVRDSTPNVCGGPNCSLGTLTIRRKFTNNTGAAVTRLRFRIVDVTTATAPLGTADLRTLTSSDVTVNLTGGGTLLVRGLTLEQPPNQPSGGGLNSSQAAGIVTVGTPIANGASINVQFVLGVQQSGNFRFFINVEALP